MESASPNGGVLISHNTYRHIQGLFDVQVLEPISVKGKVEPVQVYLVEGGKPKLFRAVSRGVEGVKASLVGREEEFQFLKDRRLAVFQDKELQMVTVIGDAGVGKSRLLYEFEKQSERDLAEIYVYRGRATRETHNQPYGLLRNLYAYYCTIQDSDPIVDVCHKVNTCLLDILDASEEGQMKSHFIGHLLGYDFCSSPYLADVLDDPQQVYHRARIYLEEFFRRSARLAPTMILLEDIHWADDSSLDLIQHLANELRNEPLLIVCLARPSLFERHTRWGEDQVYHHRLVLASLTGMDCQRLVKEILKNVERIPQELLDLIVHRADGNPFYVEELIKMMIEEGVILTSGERWLVDTSRLQELRVPPTLTGVLQARLESLPEPEQTVLQEASVVGRMFWDQAIHHIMLTSNEQGDETNIPRALDALRKREMIFRRELSSIADAEEFIFKHALLREVTYESVL
ncbi:MAG: AAA family ATPase, partial [Anaerolineales bacterium]|nr:AAA family ATPase [Anaerolineales bacterium]